jgi:histone acetyltransferase (RNA polymerase elongator complex component)
VARERLIVPIFIPHEGCPYRCVFCDQGSITGERRRADREVVESALSAYLQSQPSHSLPPRREAAFYGGSFTGLDKERQRHLLSLISPWMRTGMIHSIRVSTHPLFVDQERLALLKEYGVETVELGIQSTNAEVLRSSGRTCSWEEIDRAVASVKESGLRLGMQLMSGLPGDCEKTFQTSVEDVIAFAPDFVRMYPALVLRRTELYKMFTDGLYVPWDLERTVTNLAQAVRKFRRAGITVIRMGLPDEPALKKSYVAGPHHPSLGYLVESRLCLEALMEKLRGLCPLPLKVAFAVPDRFISNYVGHRKDNVKILRSMFGLDELSFRPVKGLLLDAEPAIL